MATVTFIKYQKQSAGTLHGVAGYVSQKQKTVQEDGRQLVSGQNCSPQLAAQEFLATRQMYRKDGPVSTRFADSEVATETAGKRVRRTMLVDKRNFLVSSFFHTTSVTPTARLLEYIDLREKKK